MARPRHDLPKEKKKALLIVLVVAALLIGMILLRFMIG